MLGVYLGYLFSELCMIVSVQHSLGLLIWGVSSPSISHVPGPVLMEIIGVLSGGGWSKEEDWQGP